eukprot:6539117-Pyramimonas_sp.AAC.1
MHAGPVTRQDRRRHYVGWHACARCNSVPGFDCHQNTAAARYACYHLTRYAATTAWAGAR